MTRWIGVDENGLGPRLGPMVVTGALVVTDCDEDTYRAVATRVGIGDSKGLCAHGAMAEVEGFVLAMMDVHLGLKPKSYAELGALLGLQDEATLRSRCPEGSAPIACFGDPVMLPAFGAGATDESDARAKELRDHGVRWTGARFALACAKRLRESKAAGQSRFDVDLNDMVSLVRALSAMGTGPVDARCGKVGGRNRYGAALDRLGPLVVSEVESAAVSRYRVGGLGTIAFVRDGDATEPAIALASLLGKWVRELAMVRHHRFYADRIEGLGPASGYHDPVTARYVAATALVRAREGVPDECFER